MADTISLRALNRATLARQMLLERSGRTALEAIDHLVGLPAQAPLSPYVGLWTRLDGFRPGDLGELISTRRAVRIHLMRTTVHLVSDRDALALGPLMRPVHERDFVTGSPFGRRLAEVDTGALAAEGLRLLTERPRTRAELGRELVKRWPGYDPVELAYGVSYLLPCVQVPPRGVWGQPQGSARWAPARIWLGREFEPSPSPGSLIRRYLAAFGPATVGDIQAWSGLTRLREITATMTGELRRDRDENGAELLDLPGAPRPDAGVPAPVRFLPEYDNLLLSHADRRRVISNGQPVPLPAGNGARTGTILIDGWWNGIWSVRRDGDAAVLDVELPASLALAGADAEALEAEGEKLLRFAAPGAARHDVRLRRQ